MFRLLKDAFKVKDIRSKILFTVFVLFVFRLGAHITVPGVNAASLQNLSSLPFFNMLNLVSGSAMQNFSIFSMGFHHTLLLLSSFSFFKWTSCLDLLNGRNKGKLVVKTESSDSISDISIGIYPICRYHCWIQSIRSIRFRE